MAALEAGHPVPEALLNKPKMKESFQIFWNAFWELSSCRGESGIPWTAIDAYSKRYNLCEMFEELVEVLERMDEVYLQWRNKEVKRGTKSK